METKFRRYTSADVDFIKANLDKGNKELGELLSRSAESIKCKIKSEGFRRSKEQVTNLRKAYNTGHFKKGSLPHNYKNGQYISKDGYIMKSVGGGVQRLKHIWLWEKINGPLPAGYCLRCVDGDIKNTDPGNWNLITRKENLLQNTIHRYPDVLIKSIKIISKLKKRHGIK